MDEHRNQTAKAALRDAVRARRASIAPDYRRDASLLAAQHFFAEIVLDPGAAVAGYWPIRDELDCQSILVRLLDRHHPVCLPAVAGAEAPLEWRLWEEGAPLYPAGFGALAPSELAPRIRPDVMLVPLLGFDRRGTRLGYGGGYYDRSVAAMDRKPKLVGLAFSVQEVEEIPREDHDVSLDAVVTEAGVRHFDPASP